MTRPPWWVVWTLLAAAGSLAITILLWPHGGVAFLILPLIFPLVRRASGPSARTCPACGWWTKDANDVFCPRDGTRL